MAEYLRRVSEFVESTTLADVPAEVVADARLSLMDQLGCILGGSSREPIARLAARLAETSPNRTASILGRRERASPLFAALVNGTSGNWLDYSSAHRHPARPPVPASRPPILVIPAALALGEELGISGKLFLESYLLGYEVGARIAIASRLRDGMHPDGAQAVVAAAVAAGKLLAYDAPRISHLVNLASSLTFATSMQTVLEGATVRNAYSGLGAFNAIMATHLLESGFTGEVDGVASVFGKVSSTAFNPMMVVADLGRDWEAAKGSYKIHACCRWNQPALDALELLMERRPFAAGEVDRVRVETFRFAAGITNMEPKGELAAKFSLPHAVGALIVLRTTDQRAFEDAAIENPQIRALAHRVDIVEDPEFSSLLPDYRPARVIVTFQDGTSLSETTWGTRGGPTQRIPAERLERKFLSLCEGAIGPGKAVEALAAVKRVDQLADVRDLTRLLVPE